VWGHRKGMAPMASDQSKDPRMVTVLGSQALGRPDGRAAILLVTKELGPIAFEVNQQAIDVLSRDLIAATVLLRQSTTKN
jgi:hypothetical protein